MVQITLLVFEMKTSLTQTLPICMMQPWSQYRSNLAQSLNCTEEITVFNLLRESLSGNNYFSILQYSYWDFLDDKGH